MQKILATVTPCDLDPQNVVKVVTRTIPDNFNSGPGAYSVRYLNKIDLDKYLATLKTGELKND